MNSMVQAWLWATVASSCPIDYVWGHLTESILEWLTELDCTKSYLLTEQPWFRGIVQRWGSAPRQQDAAEFAHLFLNWVNAPALDSIWVKRVLTDHAADAKYEDHCGQPLALKLPTPCSNSGQLSFQQLVNAKTKEDGMHSAFTSQPSLLYLQIERHYHDAHGNLRVNHGTLFIPDVIEIPRFIDATTTTVELMQFEPIMHTCI